MTPVSFKLTPEMGGARHCVAASRDPCIVHCFLPQLVGQRRGRSQVQSGRRLRDWRMWRHFVLSCRRRCCCRRSRRCCWRLCRTEHILRGFGWSGLNTQSCVRCETEREQRAGELCLPEASPGEALEEGERRQGRVTPTDVLHHASQRSVGREALAYGLTGGQPDLRRRSKRSAQLTALTL